jgi:hypothetical protein
MTVGKASALTAGFVAAFALGIAIAPSVRGGLADSGIHTTPRPAAIAPETAPVPVAPPARVNAPRAKAPVAPRKAAAPSVKVSLTEPRLHDRLKPLLNRGVRMDVAANGFRSAEEFAVIAHAARNTKVPFMVLKHRVVTEGRTLVDAIHEAKPDLDAKAEVQRAQTAAKSDLAAVVG